MKFTIFLKESFSFLLSYLILSFFLFLLNPNPILALVEAVLSFLFSLIMTFQIQKKREREKQKLSSYSFLSRFFDGLTLQKPVQRAYEDSLVYLLGYQERKSFEECMDHPDSIYQLYDYQKAFQEVILKARNDESLLADYKPLLVSLNRDAKACEEKIQKTEESMKSTLLFTLCFFFLCLLFVMINSALAAMMKKEVFSFLSLLMGSLFYPSILYMIQRRLS